MPTGPAHARPIALLGLYATLAGALSLTGWVLDLPRFTDWFANGLSIQPNAAVAATASGLALLSFSRGRRLLQAACGAVVVAVAGATLLQHVAGIDLGVDTLLMFDRHWGRTGVLFPGRMGPPGSLSWTLLGAALTLRAFPPRHHAAVAAGATVVLGIVSFSLLGYLFGAEPLYGIAWLSAIALQTSTMLLAVALGVLLCVPDRQPLRSVLERSAAGVLVRRLLPFVLLAPVLLAYVRLAGQRVGLYDTVTGVSLLVVALTSVLCAVLWWSAAAVRRYEALLASRADEHARAELVLREVNEQFLILDAEWRYVTVNDAVCKLTGRSRDELIGREVWSVFPDLVGRPFEQAARRVARARVPETLEYFSDRWQRWLQSRIYPAPNGGLAVFVEDISERRRAELALRESEGRLRNVVSLLLDVPYVTNTAGEFVAPQPAWSAYTGQSFRQARGRGWVDAIHPDDRMRVLASVDRALERAEPTNDSFRLWNARSGGYRHVNARAAPVLGPSGEPREWVAVISDVELQKQRELELVEIAREREALLAQAQAARAEAEAADRAKDEFLAVVSHELRSPLSAMTGWIEILRVAGRDPALVERAQETLARNVRNMARLVDDLLDISRIRSGKLTLELKRVDLTSVVRECCDVLRPPAEAKAPRLECDAAEGVFVMGDEARLHQIVRNLVDNALKFTPAGGRVEVRLVTGEGSARIEVEDEGEGIAPELLPRIFDRFVQAEAVATRQHGGLGLGLAIVQQLALLHGGSVRADSRGVGKGARFEVMLPLTLPAQAEASDPSAVERSETTASTPSLEVLLVEDETDSREAAALALAQRGMRVRVAASANAGVAEYALGAPDVIVSDIAMPGSDGHELIRTIRALERGGVRHTPALALTGFASEGDRRAALEAGFDDHLGKPVEAERLAACIRALAGRRDPRRENEAGSPPV